MSGQAGAEQARQTDRAGRRAAVSVFDRPVYLRAGAGTGKTTTLVARILAWTTRHGWDAARAEDPARDDAATAQAVLGGLVAMTFTEAAAADMDRKVREELRKLAAGQTLLGLEPGDLPPEAAQRAVHLLDALQGPLCTTIHAWCRGLLLRRHQAARLDPRFEIDGDGEALRAALHDAVRKDLQACGERGGAEWKTLGDKDVWPAAVAEAAATLYGEGVRAADLDADPWRDETVQRWLAEVRRRIDALFAFDPESAASSGARKADAWLKLVGTLQDMRSTLAAVAEPQRALQAVAGSVDEGLLDKLKTKSGKYPKGMAAALGSALEAFAETAQALHAVLVDAPHFDPRFHREARLLLRRLLAKAEDGLRARSTLSQSDLLRKACETVARDAQVRSLERARIRQMLLDEVQDTDPQQYELVRQLCLRKDGEARLPGLFVVGDPKQSIYGWRNADLAALERFEEELRAEHGAEVYDLVLNFRSTHAILDTVNAVVGPVMAAEPGVQPRFEALVPFRSEAGAKPRLTAVWRADPNDQATIAANKTPADVVRQWEARLLAQEVRARIDAGAKPSSIGVLSAYTSGLVPHLDALREAGVPFEFASDRSYYKRREVRDAVAWLACVVDPADKLALAAALKSPVCGLSDRRMVELFGAGLFELVAREEAWSAEAAGRLRALCEGARGAQPPGGERVLCDDDALVHAMESLWMLRALSAQGDPERFLSALRDLLAPEALEAARYLGEYRAANLARFFELVRVHLHEKGGDALALLALLRDCVERGRREGDAPAGESVEAVRIMTVHSSKGLDFEHVYLVDTGRGARKAEPATAHDLARGELRLFGSPGPAWFEAREARRRRETAERVRLWYVALTRAKNVLHVTSPLPAGRADEGGDTFCQLVARTLPPSFDLATPVSEHWRLRLEQREPEPVAIDTPGWHVDALLEPLPEAAGAADSEVALTPLARVRQDMRRVQEARTEAAQRETRALFRAASTLGHGSAGDPEAVVDARGDVDEAAGDEDAQAPDGAGAAQPAMAADAFRREPAARAAAAAGTAIHSFFEELPLDADVEAALRAVDAARIAPLVERALLREPHDEHVRTLALESALRTLDALRASDLPRRLASIWPKVVARELPMLAPPQGEGAEDALLGLRGTADMVWRDDDGRYVVVDWKTDKPRDLDERVRQYGRQLALYSRALQASLGLAEEPRRELWFLALGEVKAC